MTTSLNSLGAKLSVVCEGPRQPPTCWRRCHLPVVAGVLLEANLGIFTEGNCCYLHLNLPLWVTNEGARTRAIKEIYGAVAGDASKAIPANSHAIRRRDPYH